MAEFPRVDGGHRERAISDRYLHGTRLRLRRITDRATGVVEYKLTQKVPCTGGGVVQGTITNLHLSADEYERVAALPALMLEKTRHIVEPLLIDVYDRPLDGLIVAEAEFDTDEAATKFTPPDYVLAEVTDDPRFAGGRLARASRADLVSWLAEFGITVAP